MRTCMVLRVVSVSVQRHVGCLNLVTCTAFFGAGPVVVSLDEAAVLSVDAALVRELSVVARVAW